MNRDLRLALLALGLIICSHGFSKDFTAAECPVVGNTSSRIYHTPGGASYAKMLRQNRGKDNRECFQSEQEAQRAGYRKSKR